MQLQPLSTLGLIDAAGYNFNLQVQRAVHETEASICVKTVLHLYCKLLSTDTPPLGFATAASNTKSHSKTWLAAVSWNLMPWFGDNAAEGL